MSGGVAESVFIAGLFTLAAKEFAAIAALSGWPDDADSYRANAEKMALVTAEHDWDGEWFLRAYDHFGNRVGSARDTEGQIFIEPQGMCVMAGIGRHPAAPSTLATRGCNDPASCSRGHSLNRMHLTTAQIDRAHGVLLATAAGDALGAGYEFGPPLPADAPVTMRGGGQFNWAPGEWTDDTSMAIVIAEVAATGADLRANDAQDRIVARWAHWSRTAVDVGVQTKQVLSYVPDDGIAGSAGVALAASAELHERTGHTAGNGSLMRTAPVALAYLDDPSSLAEAALALSRLTHFDPVAGEACVLWSLAIRHAVLTGELDARAGLGYLSPGSRGAWGARLYAAEASEPQDFSRNGWVVEALQAAWCAITTALVPVPFDDRREDAAYVPCEPVYAPGKLMYSLQHAVRGGRDADTVAAIAGGLLGAACGASAVPDAWRRLVHGWPGFEARDLVRLASEIVGA